MHTYIYTTHTHTLGSHILNSNGYGKAYGMQQKLLQKGNSSGINVCYQREDILINSPENKHATPTSAGGKTTDIRTESKWKIYRKKKSMKPRVDPLKSKQNQYPLPRLRK